MCSGLSHAYSGTLGRKKERVMDEKLGLKKSEAVMLLIALRGV